MLSFSVVFYFNDSVWISTVFLSHLFTIYIHIYVYTYVCVCVCVCTHIHLIYVPETLTYRDQKKMETLTARITSNCWMSNRGAGYQVQILWKSIKSSSSHLFRPCTIYFPIWCFFLVQEIKAKTLHMLDKHATTKQRFHPWFSETGSCCVH